MKTVMKSQLKKLCIAGLIMTIPAGIAYADTPMSTQPNLDPAALEQFRQAEKSAILHASKIRVPKPTASGKSDLQTLKTIVDESGKARSDISKVKAESEAALLLLMPLLAQKQPSHHPKIHASRMKNNMNQALQALTRLQDQSPEAFNGTDLTSWSEYQRSRDALLAYTGSYEQMVAADPDSFDSLLARYETLTTTIQVMRNWNTLIAARLMRIRNAVRKQALSQSLPSFDAQSARALRAADDKLISKLTGERTHHRQALPNFSSVE